MNCITILLYVRLFRHPEYFLEEHPYISAVVGFFVLRYFLRWFFGINKLRGAQNRYTELLEQHNSMLEQQGQLLQRHEAVITRLGDKYL